MFNIGLGEIVIVLIVAFVVVGPDDLPKVARWLGRNVRKLRTLIRDIKKETGWDEVEKEVRDVQRDVKQTIREIDVSADIKDAVKDVKSEVEGITKDVKADMRSIDRDMRAEAKALDKEVRDAAAPVGEAVKDAGRDLTRPLSGAPSPKGEGYDTEKAATKQ